MKKGDLVIILMMALIVIVGSVYSLYQGGDQGQKIVVVTQDQDVIHRFTLTETYERTFRVEHGDHWNEIHIKGGQVWIEAANCKNQVCVHEKPISRVGQSIVCLPHKLMIEIEGQDDQEVDIISE